MRTLAISLVIMGIAAGCCCRQPHLSARQQALYNASMMKHKAAPVQQVNPQTMQRMEAAADRAQVAAKRAERAADKSEVIFKKSLEK